MALYQQRDSSGRTRFLLALSLSTVTALGVAAPLAIKAVRAPESTAVAVAPVEDDAPADTDPDSDSRSLTIDGADGRGGIGSREPAKA